VINKIDKPVVEEDNTSVENNVIVIDKPVAEDNTTVEDTIPVIEDKPIVKKSSKKSSKKSEEEIDFDDEIYLEHFKAKTNYTNEQRISIFKSEFNSDLSDIKIGSIINKYFKVSSARIGGKKTKVYLLEDFYAGTDILTGTEETIEESEEEYRNRMNRIFIEKQRLLKKR
jgi:hypothetical protein